MVFSHVTEKKKTIPLKYRLDKRVIIKERVLSHCMMAVLHAVLT